MHLGIITAALLLVIPQENPEDKLQAVLKKLSDFAREVDSGKQGLGTLLGPDCKPNGMITEFRTLVHEYPTLNPAVLKYLKSKDEPLGARALAVVIIAQPHKDSVAELLGSLYADPPDIKLAIVAAFAYETIGGDTIDWFYSLIWVSHACPSRGWQLPGSTCGGPLQFFQGAPENVNLNPMLNGLLSLLEKGSLGKMEHIGLSRAWEFSRRKEATEDHRRRVRSFMEKACLDGQAAWYTAIEYFSGRHAKPREEDLAIIGRSLDRVTTYQRAYAMEEIAGRFPGCLYKDPFKKYQEEMIAYLSNPEKEADPPRGSLDGIMWALLNEPGLEARAEEMLFKSPSITLRRRACGTVAGRCNYVKRPGGWDRWSPQMRRMLLDSDFLVGFGATTSVAQELEKRESGFTKPERSLWWSRATDWVISRDAKTLDPRESALFNDIRLRLAGLKP